jgi:hypothetical protein
VQTLKHGGTIWVVYLVALDLVRSWHVCLGNRSNDSFVSGLLVSTGQSVGTDVIRVCAVGHVKSI